MNIIIWHKTNFHKFDEINVYYLGDMSTQEMENKLRFLWEKEINNPEYDIDEHLKETWFEGSQARVTDYDWTIDMWIDTLKEVKE